MIDKIRCFIDQYHMISPQDTVLVGLSGGADSVCLILALHELSCRMDFSLEAVHVEHGIRGQESLEDAEFARGLCRKLDIPFSLCHVDAPAAAEKNHESLEEAARHLRYSCYEQICLEHGIHKIALAHHADDSAETMLFHLCRGTGLRGLGSIAPMREDEAGNTIIRPLLCLSKQDILQWLEQKEQNFVLDSTNQDTFYARNRIRREILPQLTRINERAVEHMGRTAEELREAADFIADRARKEGSEYISHEDGIRIKVDGFLQMHSLLQRELLLQLIAEAAGARKDLTARHVASVQSLFFEKTGAEIHLPYHVAAYREYDSVVIRPVREAADRNSESKVLPVPGTGRFGENLRFLITTECLERTENFPEIPEKTYTKWFDYDRIKSTVLLRNRREGDYLVVDGTGSHKKLNRYFIDEKIPAKDRDLVPLLADGSHIIWVIGHRISAAYKVTDQTKRVLKVTVTEVVS